MSGPRRAILRSLAIRSDDIVDASGFATSELLADAEVGGFPPQSVRRAIADLEDAGLILREINGRRVYRIGITPEGHAAADERGLLPRHDGQEPSFADVFESNDRRQVMHAITTVCSRLHEWGATADLDQGPDRLRVDMFHLLVGSMADEPPTSDELALSMVHVSALNDALLAAYRHRSLDVDPALVESTIAVIIDLARLLAATATAVESRRTALVR